MKRFENLVSVVIATRGPSAKLVRCVKSIKAQSYRRLEIIVVSDVAIALKGVKNISGGYERSNKRNLGISKSRGKYVLIVDDDLELESQVVEDCVQKINTCDFISIPELPVGNDFRSRCHRFEKESYVSGYTPVEGARFSPCCLVRSVGGYDINMVGAEDWDLTQRLLERGYKMGRSRFRVFHHDDDYNLLSVLRKKYYYGQVYCEYARRHPKAFVGAIFRPNLFKDIFKIIRHPILFMGSVGFRLIEGLAVLMGSLKTLLKA
jgi:glycosyltransferase involved in cell wall biosynthesis